MSPCPGIPVSRCPCVPLSRYPGVPLSVYPGIPLFLYPGIPLSRYPLPPCPAGVRGGGRRPLAALGGAAALGIKGGCGRRRDRERRDRERDRERDGRPAAGPAPPPGRAHRLPVPRHLAALRRGRSVPGRAGHFSPQKTGGEGSGLSIPGGEELLGGW